MITVGCAGFPVPATRYFKEFLFVEVQDTHVAPPGPSTLRRWRREAPEGFHFAMVGPREIGQEGFRDGMVVETALKTLASVGVELEADTVILVAPPDFAPTRPNRAAVKDLLISVRKKFAKVIFDPPAGWQLHRQSQSHEVRHLLFRTESSNAAATLGGSSPGAGIEQA